ncbi:hypothetical protein TSOC_015165, partial [Tetrabaena socialis]
GDVHGWPGLQGHTARAAGARGDEEEPQAPVPAQHALRVPAAGLPLLGERPLHPPHLRRHHRRPITYTSQAGSGAPRPRPGPIRGPRRRLRLQLSFPCQRRRRGRVEADGRHLRGGGGRRRRRRHGGGGGGDGGGGGVAAVAADAAGAAVRAAAGGGAGRRPPGVDDVRHRV